MRGIATIALVCSALALSGCDRADAQRKSDDITRSFMAMRGLDYDVRLEPAAADARGALLVTRSRLTFEDGKQIPLTQIETGVYRTPSLRSRVAARGSRICGGQPVAYIALHQGPGGLYYLNAGNWAVAPTLPGQDEQSIPGACETTAYRQGALPS